MTVTPQPPPGVAPPKKSGCLKWGIIGCLTVIVLGVIGCVAIALIVFGFLAGVGIIAGFVRDAIIEHNEINGTSYTGISIGWGWTHTANVMRNNLIRANHIQHIATRLSVSAARRPVRRRCAPTGRSLPATAARPAAARRAFCACTNSR